MADFLSTLQMIAGGREGCFESAVTKVDAVAVCHEVRCVALAPGERLHVTFQVLSQRRSRTPGGDRFLTLGEQMRLKGLQLDSVILLSVWAKDERRLSVDASELMHPLPEPRACGEFRFPLRHLLAKCDGALYHTWVILESPGLSDSVASIGLASGEQDAGEALSQAMSNAPRQLLQPKACLSLCRAEDLGASGEVLWTGDVARKDRIARWGPLLRSQQQHVVMCAAQHLQGAHQRHQQSGTGQQLRDLEAKAEEQARELEVLRELLRASEAAAAPEHAACGGGGGAQGLEAAIAELRQELERVGEEANSKIEAANVRIRTLRQERDDAVRKVEQAAVVLRQAQATRDELLPEKAKLTEQKDALLKIVEDLHHTCVGAGLQMTLTGRRSIDSFKFP